jgi:hypothetical protein
MLAELDRLYELGYRGHVDFVDDNLIGNKKAVKTLLPELKNWLVAHNYTFEFSTEASINLADDDELLELMRQANFFGIFVGIESPDPETLIATRKKQNTRRDISSSIHKIYKYGMFVTAGFIVGFDTEKASIAVAMADFIDECAIPVCMVGLLYALPNTQLTRRLEREGRLRAGHDVMPEDKPGDQCTLGINFEPRRPLRDILADYRQILERIFDPVAYAGRLDRFASLVDQSERRLELPEGDKRAKVSPMELVHGIIKAVPAAREPFWKTYVNCARTHPAALRHVVTLMAFYVHLGPFSRKVIAEIDRRLAAEDDAAPAVPSIVRQAVAGHGAQMGI